MFFKGRPHLGRQHAQRAPATRERQRNTRKERVVRCAREAPDCVIGRSSERPRSSRLLVDAGLAGRSAISDPARYCHLVFHLSTYSCCHVPCPSPRHRPAYIASAPGMRFASQSTEPSHPHTNPTTRTRTRCRTASSSRSTPTTPAPTAGTSLPLPASLFVVDRS